MQVYFYLFILKLFFIQNKNASEEQNEDTITDQSASVEAVALNSIAEVGFSAPHDPAFRKYWLQRYRLFSLFDSGIKLDKGMFLYVEIVRLLWYWLRITVILYEYSAFKLHQFTDTPINCKLKKKNYQKITAPV